MIGKGYASEDIRPSKNSQKVFDVFIKQYVFQSQMKNIILGRFFL